MARYLRGARDRRRVDLERTLDRFTLDRFRTLEENLRRDGMCTLFIENEKTQTMRYIHCIVRHRRHSWRTMIIDQ